VSEYDQQVRDYLDYCRAYWRQSRGWLSPEYRPTPAGACRLIWHNGDPAEARKIREAFEQVFKQGRAAA
jgi:hypothetical protein